MKARKGVKATFFRRVVAYFLDALIVSLIIGLPLASESFNEQTFELEFKGDFDIKDLIRVSIVGIFTVLYWGVFAKYKLGAITYPVYQHTSGLYRERPGNPENSSSHSFPFEVQPD